MKRVSVRASSRFQEDYRPLLPFMGQLNEMDGPYGVCWRLVRWFLEEAK